MALAIADGCPTFAQDGAQDFMRIFTGLLAVMAMLATVTVGLAPPADALGETIEVLLSQQDGTPSFDADDLAGNDSGPANGVVRTLSLIHI